MATTSRSVSRSASARRTFRPMRPSPLTAMRVMVGGSFRRLYGRRDRPTTSVAVATMFERIPPDSARAAASGRTPREGLAVLAGRGAEHSLEMKTQVGAGSEPHLVGDLLDAELTPLEEFAGEV